MKNNPYVGPRSFEREDRHYFYGRNREMRDLRALIVAEREVLFYAQSGAGKTSLLNARVIPALEDKDFHVLPLARVGSELPIASSMVENVFAFNVLLTLAGTDADPQSLLAYTLSTFLAQNYPAKMDDDGILQSLVLILDQFEELFTTHRDRWQDAEGFFYQVGAALEALPHLGVVLTMREDYVAKLDPYVHLFPHRLRARFWMERLRRRAALSAVTGPLTNTERSFAEGVAEQLVDELLEVRVETAAGKTDVITGEFVEPVQLQVVCQNLWQSLPPDVTVITKDHLQTFGDVDQALSGFYERSIKRATQEVRVKERNLRPWFERSLITPAGTRGMVYRGQKETGGIPNEAVNVLEDLHIIRGEWRAGARWYELTHDRFIESIQKSNETWRKKRRQTFFAATGVVVTVLILVLMLTFGTTWVAQQRAQATAQAEIEIAATEAAGFAEELSISVLRSHVRPLKPGLSVGEANITAGTISAFVRDKAGAFYFLTAAAILGYPDCTPDSPVVQPGPIDGGKAPDDVVGHVAKCLPMVGRIPAANMIGLVRLEEDLGCDDFESAIPGIGPIRGIGEPALGMAVRKVGRTTGLAEGQITQLDTTLEIALGERSVTVVDCIMATDMSAGGDSGALVVDERGYAVGIVIAGSNERTVLAPIQDALDSLDVELVEGCQD